LIYLGVKPWVKCILGQQLQHFHYALPQVWILTGSPLKGTAKTGVPSQSSHLSVLSLVAGLSQQVAPKILNSANSRSTLSHGSQGLRRVAGDLSAPTLNQTTADQINQCLLILWRQRFNNINCPLKR